MRQADLARLFGKSELAGHLNEASELLRKQIPKSLSDFLVPRLDSGKKLRPALLLTIASPPDQTAIQMAAAIEAVHKASLLHDDLSDEKLDGQDMNQYLLAGDYLLATGLGLATEAEPRLGAELAKIIQEMAEGQALQLSGAYKADPRQKIYQTVITQKTAALFAFSCQAGALLAGMEPEKAERLKSFGLAFGRAFQIIDDITDQEFNQNLNREAHDAAQKYLLSAQRLAGKTSLSKLPADYLARIP